MKLVLSGHSFTEGEGDDQPRPQGFSLKKRGKPWGRGWGTMKRCQSVSCRFLSSRKFSLFVFHSQKAAHLLHYSTHEMDVIPFSQIENSRYSFSIIFLHPLSQRVKGLFHPSLHRRDYPHKGERIGPPSAMT